MKKSRNANWGVSLIFCVCLSFFLIGCEKNEEISPKEVENGEHFSSNFKSSSGQLSFATVRSLQTDLNILYNVKVGGSDYMTSIYPTEASMFPINGQTYYVSKHNLGSASRPFYRLFNGSKHMCSTSSSEGNYWFEGTLGYPWKNNTKPTATTSMYRVYNPWNGDHSMSSVYNNYIPGYNTKEYFGVYGYPRFGKAEQLLTLQGNAVKVKSNLVAGGTVWELWWNNKQFIDHLDYGREMQSSLHIVGTGALPTEGGDKHHNSNYHFMHGSPLVEARNVGKTQITSAVPLEWHNDDFNGSGSADELVIYKDFILGKELSLDEPLNLGGYNYLRSQIIKYKTTFHTPIDLPQTHIEIPTAYLPAEFNRFFEVDATVGNLNNAFTEISLGIDESKQAPIHSAGGIVIATQNLNYAMGVYVNINKAKQADPDNGSIYYFRNWRFGNTTKWSAGRLGLIEAGHNDYESYVIVGTFDQVRLAMRVLYTRGY